METKHPDSLRLEKLGMKHVPGEIRRLYQQQLRFSWAPKARGPKSVYVSPAPVRRAAAGR